MEELEELVLGASTAEKMVQERKITVRLLVLQAMGLLRVSCFVGSSISELASRLLVRQSRIERVLSCSFVGSPRGSSLEM